MNRQQRRNAQKIDRQEEKRGSSYVSYDTRYVPRGTQEEVKRVMIRLIVLGIVMTAACLCVGSLPVGILSGNNYFLTIPYLIQLYASIRGLTLGTRLFRERTKGVQEMVYTRQVQRTRIDTALLVICSVLLLILELTRLPQTGVPQPAVALPLWIAADLLTAGIGIYYQRTLDGITFDKIR